MMTVTMMDPGLCRCQLSHWSMVVSAFGYFAEESRACLSVQHRRPAGLTYFTLFSLSWRKAMNYQGLDCCCSQMGLTLPGPFWELIILPSQQHLSLVLPSPSNSVSSTMFTSLSAFSFLSHHILAIPTCTQPSFPCCLPQSLCSSSSPACPDRPAKFAKWKCLLPHFSVLPPKFDRAKSLKMLLLSCTCSVTWRGSRQVSP